MAGSGHISEGLWHRSADSELAEVLSRRFLMGWLGSDLKQSRRRMRRGWSRLSRMAGRYDAFGFLRQVNGRRWGW